MHLCTWRYFRRPHAARASAAIMRHVLRRVEEAHHEIADHLLDLRDAFGSSTVDRPGGGHVACRLRA